MSDRTFSEQVLTELHTDLIVRTAHSTVCSVVEATQRPSSVDLRHSEEKLLNMKSSFVELNAEIHYGFELIQCNYVH